MWSWPQWQWAAHPYPKDVTEYKQNSHCLSCPQHHTWLIANSSGPSCGQYRGWQTKQFSLIHMPLHRHQGSSCETRGCHVLVSCVNHDLQWHCTFEHMLDECTITFALGRDASNYIYSPPNMGVVHQSNFTVQNCRISSLNCQQDR